MNKTYYFPNDEHSDAFFGGADPVCVDLVEALRLAKEWGLSEMELMSQLHEATASEIEKYGVYDSCQFVTRAWMVFGADGHRQRESFHASKIWDFSKEGKTRIIEVMNSDITGRNDCSIIRISRDTAEECEAELNGQLWDGLFEDSRVGRWEEI